MVYNAASTVFAALRCSVDLPALSLVVLDPRSMLGFLSTATSSFNDANQNVNGNL